MAKSTCCNIYDLSIFELNALQSIVGYPDGLTSQTPLAHTNNIFMRLICRNPNTSTIGIAFRLAEIQTDTIPLTRMWPYAVPHFKAHRAQWQHDS